MSASSQLLLPLLGLYPFNAQKGHGSFVTFSLTSTPDAPREEHYFWVYMCHWEIQAGERKLAHSECADDQIDAAVAALNNRRLNEILLNSWVKEEGLYHDAILFFEDDLVMKLMQYQNAADDYALFMTRDPAGRWIRYLSNGSILAEAAEG